MGLSALHFGPPTGFKRGESQWLHSEFRGALRRTKWAPRNVGAGERHRSFPEELFGKTDRDGALMGGSKGRASKLIFFLTIDNSPALNDPVATQVKTGESMHRNASGSSRPLPSWRLASVRGSGRALCRFSGCENPRKDKEGETNPGLNCRNGSRMHINRPHFCQTGKRHSQETTTATTLKRKVT